MTAITNPNNSNTQNSKRIQADDRLDNLFMTEMRCPYCQTKMPKGTSKCKNCALTKEQIYNAKLSNPYKPGQNLLMSKVRPAEVAYGKMVFGGVFGFLGIHCFMSKRYVRGVVMLLLTLSFFITFFIFPPAYGEVPTNAIRNMFEMKGMIFPCDLFGIVALGMWVWDLFAIVFGQFKYPVVPHLEEETSL